MQDYNTIQASSLISASRATINDNFETLKSNFSGTRFPTQNLSEGMLCWRTDLNKMFQLQNDLVTWVIVFDMSEGETRTKNATNAVYAEKDSEGNNIAETYYKKDLLAQLKDELYPVGSILMTMTSDNPGSWLGGEWQQIAGGRTLIGASVSYKAGATGGTESETYTPSGNIGLTSLTVAQLPVHSHSGSVGESGNHTHTYVTPERPSEQNDEGKYGGITWNVNASGIYNTDVSGNHTHSIGIGNTGSGEGHTHSMTGNSQNISHMQPYLVTYIWQKVKKAFY